MYKTSIKQFSIAYDGLGCFDYSVDKFGAIHQLNPQPFTYDAAYSATYDTEEYRRQSDILQALRFGFVTAAHGRPIMSILDVGYGNGAFMKFAKQNVDKVCGMDVTDVPVPADCLRVKDYTYVNVITFWDCLEHIDDLSFLIKLPCETLVISLPHCHINQMGLNFLKNYKHLKPNEHIHHFDELALENTLLHYGWKRIACGDHEDIVRKSTHGLQNILTMAFKKVID